VVKVDGSPTSSSSASSRVATLAIAFKYAPEEAETEVEEIDVMWAAPES